MTGTAHINGELVGIVADITIVDDLVTAVLRNAQMEYLKSSLSECLTVSSIVGDFKPYRPQPWYRGRARW